MGCEDTTELEWVLLRFPGRCYFYPGRDCAGWQAGGLCGRIGDRIPEDAGDQQDTS